MSKRKHHFLRKIILTALALGFIAGGILLVVVARTPLPDVSSFGNRIVTQSTKIFDRTGKVLLYDLHGNTRRTVVPLDRISKNVQNALISTEDRYFYQHHGIRPTSILRAIISNTTSLGYAQGGSTLTQQVVKNALLTSEKTPTRKLKEWVLSLKLERVMSKDKILELYLNEAPYGGNIYGVEEASRSFFNKNASDITIPEAAYLAALPQAPTYYSPYGNHKDKLEERKNLVLKNMLDQNMITEAQYNDAKKTKVDFQPQAKVGIIAPHFVFYVREYLEQKYGARALDEDGLNVITTLDADLQQKAEEIVKTAALQNEKDYKAENASLVAMDPKTGQVLVMVGSRDFFDKKIDGNFNIALANRQPGSSFKPFVYATAFKKGYTPETVLFDVPTEFAAGCTPDGVPKYTGAVCYNPSNYDNKFRGPISLRDSLAQSLNIPSVKTLYLAGIDASLDTARDLGITTLTNKNRYGLTLVLGGGEVKLLEMVGAYSVFANDGIKHPVASVLQVTDSNGNVLESFKQEDQTVMDENVARTISDVLSDNKARSPSYGAVSPLYIPNYDVAVKTGTTNDYKDTWIIGYSPNIAVGAWAGNNNNTPMEKAVARYIVSPMWRQFMDYALPKVPKEYFRSPLAEDLDSLPAPLQGIWQGGDIQNINGRKVVTQSIHSILYWVDKDNPRGGRPSNPASDPQFSNWEAGIQNWISRNNYSNNGGIVDVGSTNLANSPSVSTFTVLNLEDKKVYQARSIMGFTVVSKNGGSTIEISVNGRVVSRSTQNPAIFSFTPSAFINPQDTSFNLTIREIGQITTENTYLISVSW